MILSFSPDLVLGGTDWNGLRKTLEDAGVPVYTAPWLTSIDAVLGFIESVGSAVGTAEKATELVGEITQRMLSLEESIDGEDPVRAAYIYASTSDVIYAMGVGTPEDELLTRAGGINVYSDIEAYAQISLESLVARLYLRSPMVGS